MVEEWAEPTQVESRDGIRIWVRYSDGVSGEIDLSHLSDGPMFAGWQDRAFFEGVRVTPWGSIAWSEDVELCSDALYRRLRDRSVEELMPKVPDLIADACCILPFLRDHHTDVR